MGVLPVEDADRRTPADEDVLRLEVAVQGDSRKITDALECSLDPRTDRFRRRSHGGGCLFGPPRAVPDGLTRLGAELQRPLRGRPEPGARIP